MAAPIQGRAEDAVVLGGEPPAPTVACEKSEIVQQQQLRPFFCLGDEFDSSANFAFWHCTRAVQHLYRAVHCVVQHGFSLPSSQLKCAELLCA